MSLINGIDPQEGERADFVPDCQQQFACLGPQGAKRRSYGKGTFTRTKSTRSAPEASQKIHKTHGPGYVRSSLKEDSKVARPRL